MMIRILAVAIAGVAVLLFTKMFAVAATPLEFGLTVFMAAAACSAFGLVFRGLFNVRSKVGRKSDD